jgi:hypothetical protein
MGSLVVFGVDRTLLRAADARKPPLSSGGLAIDANQLKVSGECDNPDLD